MTADPGIVLPALLRASRGAYAGVIRDRLHAAGFDDVPRNAPFVLGGMVNQGGTAALLVRELGVGRDRGRELLATLVQRGYLVKTADGVEPTDRGRAAAAEVKAAVASVDAELAALISPDELAGLRAGLVALCDIRERHEDARRAEIRD